MREFLEYLQLLLVPNELAIGERAAAEATDALQWTCMHTCDRKTLDVAPQMPFMSL